SLACAACWCSAAPSSLALMRWPRRCPSRVPAVCLPRRYRRQHNSPPSRSASKCSAAACVFPGDTMHTVLITGATDGLGLALARRYRAQGSVVLTVGRRPLAVLDPDFFTPESYCQVDLALPDAAQRVAAWLDERGIGALDLLIHNAGIGYVGDLESQEPDNIRALIDVNLWAPISLSHALFPRLQAAQARCVFISSVAADMPGPRYAVYTATKAALDGFARAWRAELRADGSGVTGPVIPPGPGRTARPAQRGAGPAPLGRARLP